MKKLYLIIFVIVLMIAIAVIGLVVYEWQDGRIFSNEVDQPIALEQSDRYVSMHNLANLRSARTQAAAVAVDNQIFLLGGIDGSGAPTDLVEVYDIETDRWTRQESLPIAVAAAGAIAIGERLYLFGGFDQNGQPTDGIYSRDSDNQEWTLVGRIPTALAAFGIAELGGVVCLIDGIGDEGISPAVWSYQVEQNTWSELSRHDSWRQYGSVGFRGDRLYLFGGYEIQPEEAARTVEVLDMKSGRWSVVTEVPTEESATANSLIGDLIVMGNGLIYDLSAGQWLAWPEAQTGVDYAASTVVDHSAHLLGGQIFDTLLESNNHSLITLIR